MIKVHLGRSCSLLSSDQLSGHGVLFVKYASILLQSLTVRLDEDFLLTLYDMTKLQNVSWEDNQS